MAGMGERKTSRLLSWSAGGIRRRLLWISLIFLGVALLTNTLAGTIYTRSQLRKGAAQLQSEVATLVANRIGGFVLRKVERLADTAVAMDLHPSGSQEQRLLALLLLKNDSAFTDISVLDEKGMETLRVSERKVYLPSELFNQSASEKFKKAFGGQSFVSPVYFSDKAEPYVTVAVPVKSGPKQIVGVVSAEANLKSLWEVIGGVSFGSSGYAYLVDGRGNLIAHRDASLVLKRPNLSHLHQIREFLNSPQAVDPSPAGEDEGITGGTVLSTFAPVRGLGWAVILEEPVEAALGDVRRAERFAFLLLGVGLLAGVLIILWVSDKITKPIRELHRGVELIAKGDLDRRVQIETGDEIEQLARGFNKMAEELKISYATLEQKVEQRTRELSALYDMTTTVNKSLEIEPVLQEVIKKINEIFQFDTTRIYLSDPRSDELHLRASFPPHREDLARVMVFRRGQGVIGRVAESGEPIIFEDLRNDPRYQEWSQSKNTKSTGHSFLAAFPIKSKDRSVGAFVCNGRMPRRLAPEEIRLLASMADQIGVAVENAVLFEEVLRRSQELEGLVEINRDIAALLDREVLLPRIADGARRFLGVDGVSFRLLEGDQLVKAAYAGAEDLSGLREAIRVGESISGRSVKENRVVTVRNIAEDPSLIEEHREIMLKAGYRSFLGIPMRIAGRVIGAINLYSKHERDFRSDEINVITGFANQAAVAIENANLFAEVKNKTGELEKVNRDLEEANRAKADFLASMSHELRTPLNVIIGNAELIKDGLFGEISDGQRESLEKITRYSEILLKLINDVLTITRAEAGKMALNVSTFRLSEIVAHVQSYVEQLNRNGRLQILWRVEADVAPMTTDALKLEEILQNLIGNAYKFTPDGRIEIRVRDLKSEDRVEFAVTDTGIGIAQSDLHRIFEQFYQLGEAHTGNFSGVGLGLAIVKNYLDLMRGDIQVESRVGAGTTFTFTLPYAIDNHRARAV